MKMGLPDQTVGLCFDSARYGRDFGPILLEMQASASYEHTILCLILSPSSVSK